MVKFKYLNLEVKLDSLTIVKLKYLHDKYYPLETGGVLIGYYSEDDNGDLNIINITRVLPQSRDSINNPTGFVSGTEGIMDILNEEWDNPEKRYYIGEWHTHPDNSPEPSKLDDEQMFKYSKDDKLNCPEPILFVIGRNYKMSCNLYKNNNKYKMIKGD